MSKREWPETVCSTEMYRKEITRPYRVDGWTVCTNGHAIVCVEGANGDEPEHFGALADVPRGILAADLRDPLTFNLNDLREWCGPAEEPCPDCGGEAPEDDCDLCEGEGFIDCECFDCGDEHEARCMECDGTGKSANCETCENEGVVGPHTLDRKASLFGVPFNPRVLALILDGAPGDAVHIVRPEKDYKPFLVVGEGWRGGLMPLRKMGSETYEPVDGIALEVFS